MELDLPHSEELARAPVNALNPEAGTPNQSPTSPLGKWACGVVGWGSGRAGFVYSFIQLT